MMIPQTSFDFTTAVLDPRITFSRTGNTATRVNSSGYVEKINADLPRFDYNPVTLACRGLLIEGLKANIFTVSENASYNWVNQSDVVNNAASGPDNTVSAQKLRPKAVSSSFYTDTYAAYGATGTFTMSEYFKADGYNFIQLQFFFTGNNGRALFNLSNGTVSSSVNAVAFIEPAANGFYRCSITVNVTNTGSPTQRVQILQAPGISTFTGDGTSGVLRYGRQFEAGDLSSYVPTTGTSATRNPDIATITGTNFSDWWQASKGGAQAQATPSTVSGIRPLVQFDDGTANEIIALRGNITNPELYIVDGGIPQAQLDAGTIAANTAYSLTGWWATNDCKARKDSGAVVTDETATIPTVTQGRLGSDGANYLNGHLATVNYYDSFFGQSIYTRRKNKVVSSLL